MTINSRYLPKVIEYKVKINNIFMNYQMVKIAMLEYFELRGFIGISMGVPMFVIEMRMDMNMDVWIQKSYKDIAY